MFKWFETYFAFSRRELSGICVLGAFFFIFWLVLTLLPEHPNRDSTDMAKHIKEIEHFLATLEERKPPIATADSVSGERKKPRKGGTYFMFDPNGLPAADWDRLGLSERQIQVIKNYEAKGGQFWKKEDLKKIYSLSENDYARLEPYIQIPRTDSVRDVGASPKRTSQMSLRLSVELNATDSLALQQLPGIGPVYASRIVRFRDRLGGFHDVSQLMDVYGMDTVRFDGLKEHVYVDSGRVKKIEINLADYDRLRRHPLISPKLANAIVQYRKQHGRYQSVSDLLQIAIMDEGIFRKIVPYLTISDD